jgi:anaerobic selenocysteine-containing dehydrogenase
MTLIGSKLYEYCHGWGRALPSLRKLVPEPFAEINPEKAKQLSIQDGDWVSIESPYGSIKSKAKITDKVAIDVVCTQHGWWQGCEELGIEGYDPYSSDGANINLLFSDEFLDPISGSLPLKGFPCNIKKYKLGGE